MSSDAPAAGEQHFTITLRIPKPSRTWLRFRLRTALVLLSLSGVALWWVIAPRRTAREFVALAQKGAFAEARDRFDLAHFNEQSVSGPFTVAEFVSRSPWDLIRGRQPFRVKRFYGDPDSVDNWEFVAGPLGVDDVHRSFRSYDPAVDRKLRERLADQ